MTLARKGGTPPNSWVIIITTLTSSLSKHDQTISGLASACTTTLDSFSTLPSPLSSFNISLSLRSRSTNINRALLSICLTLLALLSKISNKSSPPLANASCKSCSPTNSSSSNLSKRPSSGGLSDSSTLHLLASNSTSQASATDNSSASLFILSLCNFRSSNTLPTSTLLAFFSSHSFFNFSISTVTAILSLFSTPVSPDISPFLQRKFLLR